MEREMDLHNNKMGIVFFDDMKDKSEVEIISFLKRKASEAVKISTMKEIENIENIENKLVYID